MNRSIKYSLWSVIFAFTVQYGCAQSTKKDSIKIEEKPKKWYETMRISGYAQVRYNRLFETNPDLKCEQCDKSIGRDNGLFIRRGRIIFSGKLHDRVYFYFQPDFASAVSSSSQHFLQVRDLYFDVFLDRKEVYRFRIGQSKVPFGFDNLQSSSRRVSIDRSDAINSAAPNERDLGLFFYYSPEKVQERYDKVYTSILKGSGDYGLIGLGVYNGQSANIAEANNNLHVVARVNYPFQLGNRNIEIGLQAYSGKFVLYKGATASIGQEFTDQRLAVSFILFPQPFGLQTEYTIGNGPRYNPATNITEGKELNGGYAVFNYSFIRKKQSLMPFVRFQYYNGGKKQEDDARSYKVYETELGFEWQPVPSFELTLAYNIGDRTFEDIAKPVNHQTGSFLRIQAQVNF